MAALVLAICCQRGLHAKGAFLADGLARLKSGDYIEAERLLTKAVQAAPQSAQALRFLAQAQEGNWEWPAAADTAERLARLHLRDESAIRRHAKFLRSMSDLTAGLHDGLDASEIAQLVEVSDDPYRHGLVRYAACEVLGRHYFTSEYLDRARKFYEVVAKGPAAFQTGRYLSDYAKILRVKGEFALSARMLERLSKKPGAGRFGVADALGECYTAWAEQLAAKRRTKQAVGLLNKAAKLDYVPAHGAYARLLAKQGKFRKAEQQLQQRIREYGEQAYGSDVDDLKSLHAALAEVLEIWAQSEVDRKRLAQAERLLVRARSERVAGGTAGVELASVAAAVKHARQLLDKEQDAFGAYRFVAGLCSADDADEVRAEAEYCLARCHWAFACQASAISHLREAARLAAGSEFGEFVQIELVRASINSTTADPQATLRDCETMLKLYPGSKFAAEACYQRGMVYADRLEDVPSAARCFRETLRLYPDSLWAKRWAGKRLLQLAQLK